MERIGQWVSGLLALLIIWVMYALALVIVLGVIAGRFIRGVRPLNPFNSEYPRRTDVKPYPPGVRGDKGL